MDDLRLILEPTLNDIDLSFSKAMISQEEIIYIIRKIYGKKLFINSSSHSWRRLKKDSSFVIDAINENFIKDKV